jgi:hypothetical protein
MATSYVAHKFTNLVEIDGLMVVMEMDVALAVFGG